MQCSVAILFVIEHHEVCYDDDGATAAALAEEETRRYRPTKNYILNRIGQIIIMRLKIWARIGWVVILVLKSSNVLDNTVEKIFLCVSNCTKVSDLVDMLLGPVNFVVYLGHIVCYWTQCFNCIFLHSSRKALKTNIFRSYHPFPWFFIACNSIYFPTQSRRKETSSLTK